MCTKKNCACCSCQLDLNGFTKRVIRVEEREKLRKATPFNLFDKPCKYGTKQWLYVKRKVTTPQLDPNLLVVV